MKTTSIKTIYLKEYELKQAIVEYLAKEHEDLAQHLYDNECDMAWGQDGKEFLVSIDGEVEDEENKEDKSLPWYGKCAHCFGGYADQECTCEPTVSKMETTAICDACGKKHNSMERHTLKTEQLSGVVMCEECSGGNTTDRVEEDILDDEDERLYDRLIKEIIDECFCETLDYDEGRMRARLRKVLETTLQG